MKDILENRSKSLEKRPMQMTESVTRDAQTMARTIVKTFGVGLGVKEIIHRLASALKISDRQAKSIYYGEPITITAQLFMRMLAVYQANLGRLQKKAEHEAAVYRALNDEWESKWGNSFCGGELLSLESARAEHCAAHSTSESLLNG
ncbi:MULTISPECIES: hypothetical protein [Acetobacter]|nr:hypothetical protein [Acetobacter orientalis]GAN66881.1 hypothetical protein Abor_031_047 [Acetobacter orientalis]GEL60874.1 hypothetical protein AOR02nite_07160 [Acetobacter orientalis]